MTEPVLHRTGDSVRGRVSALILSARDMAKRESKQYAKNKSKTLPTFSSLDELVDFFETHDMGEYWDQMPESRMDVNIRRRKHLVAIDEEVSTHLTEIAKAKKVSTDDLVNAWLKEKIRKVS